METKKNYNEFKDMSKRINTFEMGSLKIEKGNCKTIEVRISSKEFGLDLHEPLNEKNTIKIAGYKVLDLMGRCTSMKISTHGLKIETDDYIVFIPTKENEVIL